MRPVIFKCPTTNLNVQHWLQDDVEEAPQVEFQSFTCPACTRLHFIHWKTGKLLGDRR